LCAYPLPSLGLMIGSYTDFRAVSKELRICVKFHFLTYMLDL